MPKTFSESEKAMIKQRLMEEAKQCLTQYGVRKTTVDELVKRVHIPKGTFYLFYDSKELLFFDVLSAFHDEMNDKLLAELAAAKGGMDAVQLTELLFGLYSKVKDSFLLPLLANGEIELLMRKLPPEIAGLHAKKDDFSIGRLMSLLLCRKTADIETFSAALRAIFLTMLHKHEIGEDIFDAALKILIQGVVMQMIEGEAK